MNVLRLLLLCLAAVGALAVEPPPMAVPGGDDRGGALVQPDGGEGSASGQMVGPGGVDPAGVETGDNGLTVRIEGGREGTSNAVRLLLLITVLAVAPGFLMMVTSFTRIIIVLGFVRRALGTQTLPPNQVILGLALFLTLFTMGPTIARVNEQALQPFLAEQIGEAEALAATESALRDFMVAHTRKNDLALFITLAGDERPAGPEDLRFTTLVPAFVTSELKTAFQMGFVLFLPFLVIDLVIAAVLMALGMMMLPPVVVSLPFKILLFVLVDGWALLVRGLASSYIPTG